MTDRPHRRRLLLLVLIAVVFLGGVAALVFSPSLRHRRRTADLIGAARAGDVKAAEAALDQGADANGRDRDGITALMHAARGDRPVINDPAPTDHPEVVELLLARGADPNARTDSGFVALFWAARYGHDKAAKVLIDHRADVNSKDKDGMTALKWATTNDQARVVALLKEAGARE
jgi:ankyrin repeat protein